MNIYIFPSVSLSNIEIGVNLGMWAVAPIGEPHATARMTRSRSMSVPSAGLFYCSNPGVFTVPFRIESQPEDRPVHDVWRETWYLPFRIRCIGSLSNQITLNYATLTWPVFEGGGHPTHVLNLSGAMVFAPTWIPRINWDLILEQLKIDPDDYEELFP